MHPVMSKQISNIKKLKTDGLIQNEQYAESNADHILLIKISK